MLWAAAAPAIISQLNAGQEAGKALADGLLGARDPAGKMTMTWPLTVDDTTASDCEAAACAINAFAWQFYSGTRW